MGKGDVDKLILFCSSLWISTSSNPCQSTPTAEQSGLKTVKPSIDNKCSLTNLSEVGVDEAIEDRVGAGRAHSNNVTNAKHGDQALLGKEGIVDVDDNIENVEGGPGDEENQRD
jgi:hypothetical protein